jgi:AcrR family transcriptional regulator
MARLRSHSRAPYPVAARELLRDSLLDAAADLLAERPWQEITMANVAHEAGVSRQTLYKAFGSRSDFAQAYVMREVDRFLEAVQATVAEHLDDPTTALASAFDVFLRSAAEDPFVRAILADDGTEGLLLLVTTHGRPVIERAVQGLAAIIRSGWPQAPSEDAHLLAELLVRLALSHAGLPTSPTGLTAASLARLLGPYIEGVLERAQGQELVSSSSAGAQGSPNGSDARRLRAIGS